VPPTPKDHTPDDSPDALGWRKPLLETNLWVTAGLGALWIIPSLALHSSPVHGASAALVLLLLALLWAAALAKRQSEALRLTALLAFDFGLATLSLCLAGPSPGPTLILLVGVLTSALFFGRRVAIASMALVLLLYFLVARAWLDGSLPPRPNLVPIDPSTARFWLRSALGQLAGTAAIVAIVSYVLGYANRTFIRLQDSEEKFSKAFRASPEALTISDLQTSRFIDVSRGFEQWFGWKREEVVGRPALELDMWADVAEREQMVAALRDHGTLRNFRTTARKRDGTLSACMVAIETVQIGGRACLLAVLHDITAAAHAEKALRESEEKFSKAFLASPDAIVITDLTSGRYLEVNDSHERLTGYTRAEILGKTPVDIGAYQDMAERQQRIDELLQNGRVRDALLRIPRRDGGFTIARYNAELIEVAGRRCVLSVLRDVTDRVRAEQALLESEEKFSKAFQVSPNAITITEIETGRFVDVNEGYTRLFGLKREEVLGKTALEVGMWQDPEERARLMLELQANRSIRDHAVNVKNRAGQPFDMLFSADRIELGGKPHFVTVGQDVTARLQAEKALRASEDRLRGVNAELEQRVADRTAQLTAANAELESFSYSVSHDLRSPLRAIDGFSKALKEDFEDQLGEEGRDYVRRVRAASQRMGQLIDDLLQLSRATRMEMRREAVNLSELAQQIAADLRERQPEPALKFECATGLTALADPALARIVLENLLHNAWKYTRKKPAPEVELGALSQADSPRETVFYVRDNGAGFDMRYSSKLFSPFQRLHPSSEFEGTGIGLATVRRIAARHGGRVWAESVVGQGTIVYFSLAGARA
jgi:PAS domain S-box-containing protein